MHARPFLLKAHMEQDICFSIASIWKSRIYIYAYQVKSKNNSWEFFTHSLLCTNWLMMLFIVLYGDVCEKNPIGLYHQINYYNSVST